MADSEQEQPQEISSDFVKIRCRTCAAGHTILRSGGVLATYCLLLREWMTDLSGAGLIAGCDRHEERSNDSNP